MRLDHFVQLPNKTLSNNTGDTMSNNALTTPSITKSRGFKPSESVWIEMCNFDLVGTGKRIYGRIKDTGCNYIIEGINMKGDWVRVPCRRLQDAQVLLSKVMDKETFHILRDTY